MEGKGILALNFTKRKRKKENEHLKPRKEEKRLLLLLNKVQHPVHYATNPSTCTG